MLSSDQKQALLQSMLGKAQSPEAGNTSPKGMQQLEDTVSLLEMLLGGLATPKQQEPKQEPKKEQVAPKAKEKKAKLRGSLAVTFEQLAQVLRLPEGVEIISVKEDFEREILDIKLTSEEPTPLTRVTTEAQSIKKV